MDPMAKEDQPPRELTDSEKTVAFNTLEAEGDLLANRGAFAEALEMYNKALAIRPNQKQGLVLRSRCYIRLGAHQLALNDVNECLKEDPTYFKGLYQKAEVLYAMGEFESALLYYHRGHHLRPEFHEFRIGIQKSTQAIENSIGNGKKLSLPSVHLDGHGAGKSLGGKRVLPAVGGGAGKYLETPQQTIDRKKGRALGELWADKLYLQHFLEDKHFNADTPDNSIRPLVERGAYFLQNRTEFWVRQNPAAMGKRKKLHLYEKRAQHGQPVPISPSCADTS